MMSGVWFVMYGGVVLTRVLANVESNEMGLHEVPKLLLLLGFGMDVNQFPHVWYDIDAESKCV